MTTKIVFKSGIRDGRAYSTFHQEEMTATELALMILEVENTLNELKKRYYACGGSIIQVKNGES